MNPAVSLTRTNGMVVAVTIVATCLLITTAIPVPTLSGPIGVFVLCALPTIIMLDGMWAGAPDGWLAKQHRLVRGVIFLVIVLAAGAIVMAVANATIGGGQGPSTPEMAMFTIVSVVMAFWLVNMWQAWPFRLIKSKIGATVAVFLATYIIATIVYYAFFNFTGFPPVGSEPYGLFNAWYALTYLVCFLTAMFLPPAFGFLGMGKLSQPLLGVVWTVLCLVWGAIIFGIGLAIAGDPVNVLVWVPVPLLFGGLIVLVVFRDSIFGHIKALALRGVLTTVLSYAVGVGLVWLYGHQVIVANPDITADPPTYTWQLWIANATLAFTFPLLALYSNLFGQWPLRVAAPPEAAEVAPEEATAA